MVNFFFANKKSLAENSGESFSSAKFPLEPESSNQESMREDMFLDKQE